VPLSSGSPIRAIVLAGLLAGLIAGLAAGAFGLAVGESKINDAIAVESLMHEASAADGNAAVEDKPLVSRPTQHLGLVVATTLFGVSVGGLLALAFALLRGRTAHRSDRRLALGLTAAVFVAAVAVPFLKYPANPPGVGSPETIGYRTELYLLMVGGCLVALLAAWRVARLVPVGHRVRRLLAGGATFAGLASILTLRLPEIAEVPAGFPDGLLSDFRLASIGLQLTLWGVLALSFAWLVSRPLRRASAPGL
jgi:pimeloyl-ACP methyl ester carboxylesterase